MYNKEAEVNYTSLDELPEVILCDGTRVVCTIDLDKSVCSRGSFVSSDYDSDGNEIREDDWDYKQSSGSIGSSVPPDYDSDSNEIREDDWDYEQSSGSIGSSVPPDYDSDGNKIQ